MLMRVIQDPIGQTKFVFVQARTHRPQRTPSLRAHILVVVSPNLVTDPTDGVVLYFPCFSGDVYV